MFVSFDAYRAEANERDEQKGQKQYKKMVLLHKNTNSQFIKDTYKYLFSIICEMSACAMLYPIHIYVFASNHN